LVHVHFIESNLWLRFKRKKKKKKLHFNKKLQKARYSLPFHFESHTTRAGPGVSPASPWARATPHPRATNWEKKNLYYTFKKKKLYS
jgi:hypothetical protein